MFSHFVTFWICFICRSCSRAALTIRTKVTNGCDTTTQINHNIFFTSTSLSVYAEHTAAARTSRVPFRFVFADHGHDMFGTNTQKKPRFAIVDGVFRLNLAFADSTDFPIKCLDLF
jgi:hypothetical protein